MISLILICVVYLSIDATAFSTTTHYSSARLSSPSLMPLSSETAKKVVPADVVVDEIDDDDVTCYVVNDEEITTEGEKPHVVCTSEPEE